MARIIGNSLPNFLKGTRGADLIKGLGSVDALYGLGGNDKLYGGPGNDYINGGKGSDRMFGGGGHDFFQFKSGDGGFNPLTGKGDIVMDYDDGLDRFYIPGSGLGAVTTSIITDTAAGSGTLVEYSGGSFFIKNFFGTFANDDFV